MGLLPKSSAEITYKPPSSSSRCAASLLCALQANAPQLRYSQVACAASATTCQQRPRLLSPSVACQVWDTLQVLYLKGRWCFMPNAYEQYNTCTMKMRG